MNAYKPGQSFRASLVSTSLGVLTDPSNLTATMHLPDGSVTNGTPVQDSVGNWHADFLIPFTTPPGIAKYRFRSTGAAIGQNAIKEQTFRVDPLEY